MSGNLYIIRHGLTDWNVAHRLQGQTDTDLNEDGIRMAHEAASEYKVIHFDVCYCSPLKRARMTAEILLEGRDVPIIIDDRLKEMSFGIYEGFENCFSFPDCPMYAFFKNPLYSGFWSFYFAFYLLYGWLCRSKHYQYRCKTL